jgi:hypothetical protein
MNNSTIYTADRNTHLKIVVLSLIASISILIIGIASHVTPPDASHIQASGPPLKAGKPMAVTDSDALTVR